MFSVRFYLYLETEKRAIKLFLRWTNSLETLKEKHMHVKPRMHNEMTRANVRITSVKTTQVHENINMSSLVPSNETV